MSDASFRIDYLPLLIAIIAGLLFFLSWQKKKNFPTPHLGFSNLTDFQVDKRAWRSSWANLAEKLLLGALFFFLLAFLDPRFLLMKDKPSEAPQGTHLPTEGIAIYFVLDRSGSMVEEVPVLRKKERKIDLLKQVTTQFIQGDPKQGLLGRPNDMIGLIAFARGAQVLAPLTLDHQAILNQLTKFNVVGNREQDGTAIGHALFKAANLISATKYYAQEISGKGEPAFTIKSYVIILVTDGLQDPNPLDKGKRLRNIDIPEAAAFIKEQGIRLYAVVIEPKLSTEEFAPYRRLMDRVTKLTGGKFYMMDGTSSLKKIYHEIDQLEKSVLPQQPEVQEIEKDKRPDLYERLSLSPYFLGIALLCLFAAFLLETVFLRKAP